MAIRNEIPEYYDRNGNAVNVDEELKARATVAYVDQEIAELDQKKIDNPDTAVNYDRALIVEPGQLTVDYKRMDDTNPTSFSIAVRDDEGKLWATDPVQDQQVATKRYVDDSKVAKISESGSQRVYAVSATGTQETINVADSAATAGTLVKRAGSGTIITGTPTAANHAATKAYVDDNLPTRMYQHTINITTANNNVVLVIWPILITAVPLVDIASIRLQLISNGHTSELTGMPCTGVAAGSRSAYKLWATEADTNYIYYAYVTTSDGRTGEIQFTSSNYEWVLNDNVKQVV